MNPFHRFALLLTLLGSAAAADEGFRIMDEAEMARHKAQLASLQGQAREDYRNQVWQALRQRARAHGYQMPETPPWSTNPRPAQAAPAAPPQTIQVAATSPESAPADDSQTTARSSMPQQVEKHRQVIEQAASREATTSPDDAQTKASIATREYQQQMRERFERFMAQRRARQEQARRQRELARQQRALARAQREAARWQREQQRRQSTRPPLPARPAPAWPAPPAWPGYPPQHPPAWPGYPPAPPSYWY